MHVVRRSPDDEVMTGNESRRVETVRAARRHKWAAVGWFGAVTATVLNGILVGYGAIWFQLFGDVADVDDYAVSAGGYGAAALVLALAVPAIVAHGRPKWLVWPTGMSAALLGLLALGSAHSTHAGQGVTPMNTVWDGIGGVLWAPWTWVLVTLGIHGLGRIMASPVRASHGQNPSS